MREATCYDVRYICRWELDLCESWYEMDRVDLMSFPPDDGITEIQDDPADFVASQTYFSADGPCTGNGEQETYPEVESYSNFVFAVIEGSGKNTVFYGVQEVLSSDHYLDVRYERNCCPQLSLKRHPKWSGGTCRMIFNLQYIEMTGDPMDDGIQMEYRCENMSPWVMSLSVRILAAALLMGNIRPNPIKPFFSCNQIRIEEVSRTKLRHIPITID